MGQVPDIQLKPADQATGPYAAQTQPRYGILGDGRAARHFAQYLSLKQIQFIQTSRKAWEKSQSRDTFSTYIQTRLQNVSTVLLIISDSGIETTLNSWPPKADQRLVHFSGALTTTRAFGWHPLMTFGEDLYELSIYESMLFVGEAGAPAFHDFFPELKNPSVMIPREDKALYHAFCVLSGNFSNLLWTTFFKELETRWEISRSLATPYLNQVTKNLAHSTTAKSGLTGPIARGDTQTIEKNLAALKGHPTYEIYQAFVAAFGSNKFLERGEYDGT